MSFPRFGMLSVSISQRKNKKHKQRSALKGHFSSMPQVSRKIFSRLQAAAEDFCRPDTARASDNEQTYDWCQS